MLKEDIIMGDVAALDSTRLIIAALIGLALLLLLIIKFKIHAMLSILIGAVTIGLVAGMPFSEIVTAVDDGIGNTLKGIALLVGLGSMFGAILEASGGAQTLAVTMVKKFGDKKAAWALGITGLVIAMPVFFDAGLIILIPLAFSLAKRTKRSSLFYVVPLLAGLAVGHAFIPPTPGPVLVATMLNVDLGWVILVGIFCGTCAMIVAGPIWGSICGRKYDVPVPEHVANQEDFDESKLPSFGTVVGIILFPLVLIVCKSLAGVIPALSGIEPILTFLGQPFMALLLATLVAMFLLGKKHGYTLPELEKIMTKSCNRMRRRTALHASVFRTWRCNRQCGCIRKSAACTGRFPGCCAGQNLCWFGNGGYDDGGGHYCGDAGYCGTVSHVPCLCDGSGSGRFDGMLSFQ